MIYIAILVKCNDYIFYISQQSNFRDLRPNTIFTIITSVLFYRSSTLPNFIRQYFVYKVIELPKTPNKKAKSQSKISKLAFNTNAKYKFYISETLPSECF